jgi:ABC-type dipeptide/oligopeptide/nickel transport system permease subunit
MKSRWMWTSGLSWAWLVAMLLIAILAPALARFEPNQIAGAPLAAGNPTSPLGTDALGRDLLTRLVYGARASIGLSTLAAVISVAAGAVIGFAAAMFSGLIERVTMWFSNVLLAIPGLLLAMLMVAALEPGIAAVILAVGVGGVPGYARMARSIVRQLLGEGYVEAALAAGGNRVWIGVRHILPNALPQLGSLAGTYFAWAFLGTTTLTFLGLAGDPALAEWGSMLDSSRAHLRLAPQLAALPAVAISLTVLAVHTLAGLPKHPRA